LPILFFSSCTGKSESGPRTYKVTGNVSYQGKPVPEATLLFKKVDQSRGAVGQTNSDGKFQLTTFELDDGALVGEYQVSIVCYEKPRLNASEAEMYHLKNKLPAKYEDVKKSGLTATVVDNDRNTFNFDLK